MGKVCVACGIVPPEAESDKPAPPPEEPEKCPNCGEEGTMEERPDEEEEDEE
jgi:hypothetical protein